LKSTYKTTGTCSRKIEIEVEDAIIKCVDFSGGCEGNSKGIASLVSGMRVSEAIERLEGITCGWKNTSCPDQLAQALKEMA